MPYTSLAELPQIFKTLPRRGQQLAYHILNEMEGRGMVGELASTKAVSILSQIYGSTPEGWQGLNEETMPKMSGAIGIGDMIVPMLFGHEMIKQLDLAKGAIKRPGAPRIVFPKSFNPYSKMGSMHDDFPKVGILKQFSKPMTPGSMWPLLAALLLAPVVQSGGERLMHALESKRNNSAILAGALNEYPTLKDENPAKVLKYFGLIRTYAPRFTQHPLIAGSMLKNMVDSPLEQLDYNFVQNLMQSEKLLQAAQASPTAIAISKGIGGGVGKALEHTMRGDFLGE